MAKYYVVHCKECDKFHISGTKIYNSHRNYLSKVRNVYHTEVTPKGKHSNVKY